MTEGVIMDVLAAMQVYRELADWYERQGQAAMRDRFLILAAEAAFSAGKPEEADRLRQRLLQGNPHHMLKPFSSFAQALQSTNIQIYIHDLQVNYPPEAAEGLLRDLRGGKSESAAEAPLDVPATAPLIELRDEPTLPLGSSLEAFKVYPMRDEPEPVRDKPEKPPPPPIQPTHLERPAPRKSTIPPPERPSLPKPSPSRIPAAPPRSARPLAAPPPPPAEPIAPAGAWLTLVLFGMTVTAGAALALYVLARPFLPPHWLP
jgi:hypothetical protein